MADRLPVKHKENLMFFLNMNFKSKLAKFIIECFFFFHESNCELFFPVSTFAISNQIKINSKDCVMVLILSSTMRKGQFGQ